MNEMYLMLRIDGAVFLSEDKAYVTGTFYNEEQTMGRQGLVEPYFEVKKEDREGFHFSELADGRIWGWTAVPLQSNKHGQEGFSFVNGLENISKASLSADFFAFEKVCKVDDARCFSFTFGSLMPFSKEEAQCVVTLAQPIGLHDKYMPFLVEMMLDEVCKMHGRTAEDMGVAQKCFESICEEDIWEPQAAKISTIRQIVAIAQNINTEYMHTIADTETTSVENETNAYVNLCHTHASSILAALRDEAPDTVADDKQKKNPAM